MRVHQRWLIQRDFPEVLAIDRDGFDPPWTEEEFLTRLRQRTTIGMIAESLDPTEGKHWCPVVGFFIYTLHEHHVELHRIAVAPRYRRRGVGRAMLAKLNEKLSAHRRTSAMLSVPDDNLNAHLWLRACGWWAEGIEGDAYLFRCDAACEGVVIR